MYEDNNNNKDSTNKDSKNIYIATQNDNISENEDNTINRYDDNFPMLNHELELQDLNNIYQKNKNKILIGHLNINSLRNKFSPLKQIIQDNIDIFLVSETKIDNSYPEEQFTISGFSTPHRLDRNDSGGGLLLYVREDIPSKLVKSENEYEGIFVEINIKKQKWLISCSYNPHLKSIDEHLEKLQISIDSLSSKYENLLLLGDFNCEISKSGMQDFCDSLSLKDLIKVPTCFKNPEKPKCIDHILTNRPDRFQRTTYTVETGLSDFHKMTLAILKVYFIKLPPKIIKYRSYRNFQDESFHDNISAIMEDNNFNFDLKIKSIVKELDKMTPFKSKTVRGNDAPFMNKELRKAIMVRSRLRNFYHKDRTWINRVYYKRQRNYCVSLLRRVKKTYFEKLEDSNLMDSKNSGRQ